MRGLELRRGDRLGDMVGLQQLASRTWPGGGHHPGGMGWALAIDELYPELRVATSRDRLVGWAGAAPSQIEVHVEPAAAEAAAPLLDWAVHTAGKGRVSIALFEGDGAVRALAAEAGFSTAPGSRALYGMFRHALGAGAPSLVGYRVRGLARGEERARVEAHREAWRPAALPFAEGVDRAVDPAATSSFTWAKFEQVSKAWLYDPELDLVVETVDGVLVGTCTVWLDPTNAVAEIEPLGVHPAHRRRGLAIALCLEACARVAARGGSHVFINTGPRHDYPAPAAAYTAAGFAAVPRGVLWGRDG